jgi:hypothetical protein
MKGAKGNTCTPMAALLSLVLVALLYNAAPTMGAACVVSATKVAGCKTCTVQNRKTVCTSCTTGAVFNKGSCGEQTSSELPCYAHFIALMYLSTPECPVGFGSKVAVPVPARKGDPNYTRLFNKQKAYDKVYNGKSCKMCPDEYATGKATKLRFSAAICKPCAAGTVPDAKHALCLGEYLRKQTQRLPQATYMAT